MGETVTRAVLLLTSLPEGQVRTGVLFSIAEKAPTVLRSISQPLGQV